MSLELDPSTYSKKGLYIGCKLIQLIHVSNDQENTNINHWMMTHGICDAIRLIANLQDLRKTRSDRRARLETECGTVFDKVGDTNDMRIHALK